jgi:hypothetical protein
VQLARRHFNNNHRGSRQLDDDDDVINIDVIKYKPDRAPRYTNGSLQKTYSCTKCFKKITENRKSFKIHTTVFPDTFSQKQSEIRTN